MDHWEIILIVFGTSATIIVIFIFVCKWVDISFKNCCKCKIKLYKDDDSYHQPESERRNFIFNSRMPFGFNSNEENSVVSLETCETFDFSNICMGDFKRDSLIIQPKPLLKNTILCNVDLQFDQFPSESQKIEQKLGKLQIELNYNAFEENLEVRVFKVKDICFDLLKFDQNSTLNQTLSIEEIYEFYLIFWINDNHSEKRISKKICLKETNNFDTIFKWLIDDSLLMEIKLNILMYKIDLNTGTESIYASTSINIGEFYFYYPVNIELTLHDPEKITELMGEVLVSLSYFPTAERFSITIVEARNLLFNNNSIFGNSFVKISLIKGNGQIETFRTSVRINDPNPQFNEISVFKVSTKELKNTLLKISVYESFASGNEIMIGHFSISSNKTKLSLSHWQQMLKSVTRQVSMWHSLEKS